MSIAVIVVNYAAADLAIAAVDSVLARQHGGRPVEIHLVDNASPGEDAQILQSAYETRGWADQVTLWLETTNHGFGRGNNVVLNALAARAEPPEFVFLLNPDAQLENEALDLLVADLEAHPDAVAVGAGIVLPDGTPVPAAFRFPDARSEIARSVHFGPVDRLLRAKPRALPPETPTGPVDWVAGAAVLMRLEAVQAAGFFDPCYFLYYEEVDLMQVLTEQGGQIRYHPHARVVHVEGASTGVQSGAEQRRRRPPFVYRSWRRFFSKRLGPVGVFLLAVAVWIGSALGLVISKLRGRDTDLPLQFFGDHLRYLIAPLAKLRRDADYDADIARYATRRYVSEAQRGHVNANPDEIGFWALVAEDFRTHDRALFAQGFCALFWHRFGNWRMSVRARVLRAPLTVIYRVMYKVTQWVCGIDLPFSVVVGRRVKLEHFGGMILVAERIGDDVTIRQNTTFGISGFDDLTGRPSIGDRVEIGAGAVVVGRLTVGADAIIGANAVVRRDVPEGAIVGGVPARVLRQRTLPQNSEAQDND